MISRSLYKGKYELTMAQFEALPILDTNLDYNITDYPSDGITSDQMVYALSCTRLFDEGTIFICKNDGVYSAGHIYELTIVNGAKTWTDITYGISSRSKRDITEPASSIINRWNVKLYPDGDIIASVELDYTPKWDEYTTDYIQETLPTGLFESVDSCECQVIDISTGTTYHNSIITATKELYGITATSKVAILPLETALTGNSNYPSPTKLHIVWKVKGN